MPRVVVLPASSFAAFCGAGALACLLAVTQAFAQSDKGAVSGAEMAGFGRIVFSFDHPIIARSKTANGVLVLSFDEPVNLDLDKLPGQAPAYIAGARRDPDGKTVRLALPRNYRANLMEAGEKLFLDLLPESWAGLPPSLPHEIVEQLARRAREAEETLRKANREREKREPRDLVVRVASGPTFNRIIFQTPLLIPITYERKDDTVRLLFDAALRLDTAKLKPDLPADVKQIEGELAGGMLALTMRIPKEIAVRGFREDDSFIVDIPNGRKTAPAETSLAPGDKSGDGRPGEAKAAEGRSAESHAPDLKVVKAETAAAPAARPAEIKPITLGDGRTLKPQFEKVGDSLRVTFAFGERTPAAAFQRAGTVWLVFETALRIDGADLPRVALSRVASMTLDRAGSASIVRLQLTQPAILNFAARDSAWVATIGEQGVAAAVPLTVGKGVSEEGRTMLTAKLPSAGAVQWIDDPDVGDRLAVVTALGPSHALPKPQTFIEVRALPTSHGLVFAPLADDVIVRSGLDEVTVSRDRGLTLSFGVDGGPMVDAGARELFVDPAQWRDDAKGAIRTRGFALTRDAADLPKRERTEARLRLARFDLANGLYPEAAMLMKVATSEDQTFGATRTATMAAAIAATLAERRADATRLLASPSLALDPEAGLWRATLAAQSKHWQPALVGFRQSLDVLDRYPEALSAKLRPLVAESAIESGELLFASAQLDLFERDAGDGDRAQAAYLRGRLADAQGRVEEALAYYDQAVKGPRPVEARARLARAIMREQEKQIPREDAIAELETVGAVWRRDDVEVKALAKLGRLYAADGRWRDAFGAARRAVDIMPDHELTRGLQDEMAGLFEQIFLDGQDESLPKVEALGLYYDFRMFTPPGRRGDEMIRRLSDRLASLDLLDQATELLQHQVDNRLSGLARSQVAARLSVLYLMNRKPVEAIEALRATRMGELPPDLRRARTLLEARALSELSRTDLAMEMLAPQAGEDVNRLRADVLWRGKRWRDAGEAFEVVLGDRWQDGPALTAAERNDVMRAGICYVLADDALGVDRLRTKYAPRMADSADTRAFTTITGDASAKGKEFRDLARSVVSVETLTDFLAAYRKRYPGIAGAAPSDARAAKADAKLDAKLDAKADAKADLKPESLKPVTAEAPPVAGEADRSKS